jgi:leucyl-tRNA synthetase
VASEVERDGGFFHDGQPVNREFGKIGKSLKNMITPDDLIGEFGADTLRLYAMFTGPLDQSRPWETKAVVGVFRLLQRIWRNVLDEDSGTLRVADVPADDDTRRVLHRSIAAVRDGMETLRFNTSIARITELNNHLTARFPDGGVPREVAEPLVLMMAPITPHVAEELWARMGHTTSLAFEPFPVADPALLVDDSVEYPVQVNGKVRSRVTVPAAADRAAVEAAALGDAKVATALSGRAPAKVIVVPGRLVNIVV